MSHHKVMLPNEGSFLDDLILQRTGAFIALGGGELLGHWFNTGEKTQLSAALRKDNLVPVFINNVCKKIAEEVDTLLRVTKRDTMDHFVSIGPGNGIFEMMIYEKIKYERILLIDIEHTDDYRHGFHEQGSGYASLKSTKEFMVSNGVPADKILLCNPRKEKLPPMQFDMLISLLSMGFHYPCDEYVDFILENIRPCGFVVFDKRKDVPDPGFELLSEKLNIVEQVDVTKFCRVFATTKITS